MLVFFCFSGFPRPRALESSSFLFFSEVCQDPGARKVLYFIYFPCFPRSRRSESTCFHSFPSFPRSRRSESNCFHIFSKFSKIAALGKFLFSYISQVFQDRDARKVLVFIYFPGFPKSRRSESTCFHTFHRFSKFPAVGKYLFSYFSQVFQALGAGKVLVFISLKGCHRSRRA